MAGSIYGMNVNLPLQSHPLAFWYVIGTAAIVSIGVVVFMRKGWL